MAQDDNPDIQYSYAEGKITVSGTVLQDVRIGAYLFERGLRRERRKYWVADFNPDQVTNLLFWFSERGWTVKSVKPKKSSYKAKTNNVSYYYGKRAGNPVAFLRGGGLQYPEAKETIKKYNFKWVYRRTKAYVAHITPHRLIEVLVHLKMMGLNISPSKKLKPRRWLYLDLPRICEKQVIKSGDTIPFDDLVAWLEENAYSRLSMVEQPGDYSLRGDTFHIWTKQEDTLIRIVFDGETVESIAEVDPETIKPKFVAETTINGLVETAPLEAPILPTPQLPKQKITDAEAKDLYGDLAAAWMCKIFAESFKVPEKPKSKYEPQRIQSIFKSFTQLDETHPFFNMVKWNK